MKGRMIAAALAASVVVAAPAEAVTTIPGSPLTVYVGDRGQLQAWRTGDLGGIFYPSSSTSGDAGFFLAFPAMTGQNGSLAGQVFGFTGYAGPSGLSLYTPVSQDATTGSGAPGSPLTQKTVYSVSNVATVAQTTTYVNGAQEFRVRWDVTNGSAQPLPFKALAAADFYFEGSDYGTGIFSPGPPRFVGGTNSNTGRSGGFLEATPWDAWQALSWESPYATDRVWSDVVEQAAASTAPSFDKSIEARATDNAGGVEWDDTLSTPLAAGATRTYELLVRSAVPAALAFDRMTASGPQGSPLTYVVTAKDTSGAPFTGKTLRYAVMGPNAGSGAVTIDGNGNAAITDPGTHAGNDTIVAYLDLDNSGSRNGNEPQASVTALIAVPADRVPPACTLGIRSGRPGAGKPVFADVKCDAAANLVVSGSFTVTVKKKRGKARKIVANSAKAAFQTLVPGTAVPVTVRVPSSIAKKYAGAKVAVTVTVDASDASRNRATKTASRTLKLAAVKTKKKHHR